MGCWSATCMISNTPIRVGQPVVAAFMTLASSVITLGKNYTDRLDFRGEFVSGAACEQGIFFPRSLIFRGQYNDYGCVEHIKPAAYIRAIVDQFREDIVIRNDPYSESGGRRSPLWPDLDPKTLDIESLIEVAERGALAVKSGYQGTVLPVGLCLIHKGVAEAMIRAVPYELVKKLKADLKKVVSGSIQSPINELRQLFALSILRQTLSIPCESSGEFFVKWLQDHYQELSDKDRSAFEKAILDTARFRIAMNNGRYAWNPVIGSGSQDNDMTVQRAVAHAVLKMKAI